MKIIPHFLFNIIKQSSLKKGFYLRISIANSNKLLAKSYCKKLHFIC